MSRKHYHVIMGMDGYMPDTNDVCRTKRDALASARWWADQIRDDGYGTMENPKVSRDGYGGYRISCRCGEDCHHIDAYIEVNACADSDCEVETE